MTKAIKLLFIAAALSGLLSQGALAAVVQITVKDAGGTTRTFNVTTNTDLTGNLSWNNVICGEASGGICASVGTAGSPSTNALTVQALTLGHGTAANAMRVELPTDGTGVVGLAAGTSVALAGGTTVGLVGGTTVGLVPGTAVGLSAGATVALAAGTNVGLSAGAAAVGTVDPTTIGSWGLQVSTQNSAVPTRGQLALGQFNTAPTTITTGNVSPLQMDAAGNLLVNIKAGAGSGGTASTFGVAFPGTGTAIGVKDSTGTNMVGLNVDASGFLKVNVSAGAAAGGTSSNFGATFPGAGTAVGMTQGGNLTAFSGTSGNLNVQCANCSGSGVSAVDSATFTATTSLFAPGGGFFQTTPTNVPLTSGQQGAFQVTANRALFTNLRNAAGTEVGTSTTPLQVTVANTGANATAMLVTGTGGTFPATQSGTWNIGTVATITNPVAATQSGTWNIGTVATITNPVAATQSGTWNVTNISGTVSLPTGAATAALQPTNAALGSTTTGQTGNLALGAVTTGPPTYTSGQSNALSLDPTGSLRVNVTSGGGTGGTSSTFGATFPGTGTAAGAEYLTTAPTLTNGQMVALQTTINGSLHTTVDNTNPNGPATMANSSPVTIASNQTSLPVTVSNTNPNGQSTMANSAPVVIASNQSAIPITGPNVNGQTTMANSAPVTIASNQSAIPVNVSNINSNGQATATNSSPVVLASNQSVADPCTFQAKTNASIATSAGTLQLVAPSGTTNVYICSLSLIGAATAVVNLVGGTGATCTTGTPSAVLGSTTAASGLSLAANGGLTLGNGNGTVGKTSTNGHGLCLVQSGTTALAGNMTYIQQ